MDKWDEAKLKNVVDKKHGEGNKQKNKTDIVSAFWYLLCLNQILYALYALCLSYHSNTEAVLFACLSSGWTTTTGRLLGTKVGNSISVFPKDTATHYHIGSQTKDLQPLDN